MDGKFFRISDELRALVFAEVQYLESQHLGVKAKKISDTLKKRGVDVSRKQVERVVDHFAKTRIIHQ